MASGDAIDTDLERVSATMSFARLFLVGCGVLVLCGATLFMIPAARPSTIDMAVVGVRFLGEKEYAELGHQSGARMAIRVEVKGGLLRWDESATISGSLRVGLDRHFGAVVWSSDGKRLSRDAAGPDEDTRYDLMVELQGEVSGGGDGMSVSEWRRILISDDSLDIGVQVFGMVGTVAMSDWISLASWRAELLRTLPV